MKILSRRSASGSTRTPMRRFPRHLVLLPTEMETATAATTTTTTTTTTRTMMLTTTTTTVAMAEMEAATTTRNVARSASEKTRPCRRSCARAESKLLSACRRKKDPSRVQSKIRLFPNYQKNWNIRKDLLLLLQAQGGAVSLLPMGGRHWQCWWQPRRGRCAQLYLWCPRRSSCRQEGRSQQGYALI